MTKIISFVVGKGGGGKTTLAHSLIKYATDKGLKVVALDADSNLSLYAQVERRREYFSDNNMQDDYPIVETVSSNMKTGVTDYVQRKAKGYDLCIVDTAGAFTLFHEAVCMASNLVIIPTMFQKKFTIPAKETFDIISEIQQNNGGLPIAALAKLNTVKGSVRNKEHEDYLSELPCFSKKTTNYPALYSLSDLNGLSITELDSIGSKAEKERGESCAIQMRQLCQEILDTVEQL